MIRPALLCAALATAACQTQAAHNADQKRQLEQTNARLDKLEQRLAQSESERQEMAERLSDLGVAIAEIADVLQDDGEAGPPSPPRRPSGPDPTAVYAVPVDGAPFRGAKDAKVTIVMASEFACPYCERVRGTLDQLVRQNADVKLVYRHYVVHPEQATIPAYAACAAHKQGKFWEMYALIFDRTFRQDQTAPSMENLARDLALDLNRFRADMGSAECAKVVADDQTLMTQVGTRGTPSFYINGRHLSGAQPYEKFQALVDEELAKANKALKANKKLKVKDYYRLEVLGKGKTGLD